MKVIKLAIFIGIISILFCLKSNFAYADGSSFAAKTLINTPQGKIAIEKLSPGDLVVGYDFTKHQQTINQISSIKTNSSLSYFLINDRVKIAGTQPIYKKTSNNPEIVRVHQLKEGDLLLTQDRQDYLVAKIEQVVKPSNLYQIILENQADNLFADRLLIYSKDAIEPIIKQYYAYLYCDFSMGSYRCFKVNSPPTKLVVLITFSLLILGIFLTDKLSKWISSK